MMKPALLILATLIASPAACRAEDPRIAGAEAIAEATCACNHLQCASDAAAPLLGERGLEQEDYANLPEDQIARFHAAVEGARHCVRRWILE